MDSKYKEVEETNDRAVSPVIGVILMVAITVILAAVIAAFVLDIGPGETGPSAQMDIEFEEDGGEESDEDRLSFLHNGGDSFEVEDVLINVQGEGDSYELDGEEISGVDNTMSTGDVAELDFEHDDEEGTLGDLSDETHTIQLIHEPSDSVIVSEDIEFPDSEE